MPRDPVQALRDRKSALSWTDRHAALGDTQRDALVEVAVALAERVRIRRLAAIGLCGAPGSGKSTLAHLLCQILNDTGTPAECLGVDDYYLTRAQRLHLARTVHPLFMRRGVPGTHDLDLLVRDFDLLRSPRWASAERPRFDKSVDDRAGHYPPPAGQPAFLVLEGWFIGSEPSANLPRSTFLESRDPDGAWQRRVRSEWKAIHEAFAARLEETWYLHDPGWEQVIAWRQEQERQLAKPALKSREQVIEFLETFHGLYELIRSQLPGRADVLLRLGQDHVLRFGE